MKRINVRTKTHGISSPKYKNLSKRLYTITEASIYLGRSVWSVRELIWKGELPSVRVERRVHLDICDLDAFIETNKAREYL